MKTAFIIVLALTGYAAFAIDLYFRETKESICPAPETDILSCRNIFADKSCPKPETIIKYKYRDKVCPKPAMTWFDSGVFR